MSIRKIALSACIAAVYAAVTILLAPISYGPLQIRLSEVLCILPFFFPFSVWGLTIGCLLSNLLSVYGILDTVFGTFSTLLAALCTMRIGQLGNGKAIKALACLPPVLINAIIISGVITISTAAEGAQFPTFIINLLQIGLGEAVVMYAIAFPMLIYIPRTRWFPILYSRLN